MEDGRAAARRSNDEDRTLHRLLADLRMPAEEVHHAQANFQRAEQVAACDEPSQQ
jgi:hypothetical protein